MLKLESYLVKILLVVGSEVQCGSNAQRNNNEIHT